MPAVTADTLTLPKVPAPAPGAIERPVRSVTTAPRGFEGEGFPVRRAFAGVDVADLDPFIHMDQMGEVDYAPGEPRGTDWHPHRGFETVTYMIDGTFQHQDSHGRRRRDHQRRHPVDDGGRRHPPHRDPAGAARRQRRPLPRDPAVGQPAGPRQDGRPRLPEPRSGAGDACSRRPTAAHSCGSSPATWPGSTVRVPPTRRSPSPTPRWRPARGSCCRGVRTSTR